MPVIINDFEVIVEPTTRRELLALRAVEGLGAAMEPAPTPVKA